jgi:hypothetical protein
MNYDLDVALALNDDVDERLTEWQQKKLGGLIYNTSRQNGSHIDSLPVEASLPVNDKPLVPTLKSFKVCLRFKDEQIVEQIIEAPTSRIALVTAAKNICLADVRGATISLIRKKRG